MSNTAKPVVVGIGDKQPSALRYAIGEARSFGSRLRVVHSSGIPAQAAEFYLGVNATMLHEFRTEGQAVLDDARHVIEGMDPTLDVDYILSERPPLEALEREAATARVLVVGVDDIPWFDRLLRTQISGYLAKHAPCPVVVVPEQQFPTGPDGEVVVTLDGDTSASGPLRLAFEEASARDCVLHVLHATPPGTLRADADAVQANVSEVLAGWRETYPDVMVFEGYALDDTSAALICATQSAELVVMGRPHHHNIPLALSRPMAMTVLRHAQCPVAIVPADYQGA